MGGGVSGCKGKGKVSSAERARRLLLSRAWEKVEALLLLCDWLIQIFEFSADSKKLSDNFE